MHQRHDEDVFSAQSERRVSERVADHARRQGLSLPGLDRDFWEHRWKSAARPDRPTLPANHTLTDIAAHLAVGEALDAGCGEGADAIWLAGRGWTVTAVDFVGSALDRGRHHADLAGPDVASRISWQQHDLSTWIPAERAFDLVTTHYLHGIAERDVVFRRLAAAVRPGGTLLIVGHHPANADMTGGAMPEAVLFTTADVVSVLGDGWELVSIDDDVPRRTVTDGARQTMLLRSSLVQARRGDQSITL
ncbi:class I SAM-dependent methyltransferase [Mycobacterium sp. NPDC003323]